MVNKNTLLGTKQGVKRKYHVASQLDLSEPKTPSVKIRSQRSEPGVKNVKECNRKDEQNTMKDKKNVQDEENCSSGLKEKLHLLEIENLTLKAKVEKEGLESELVNKNFQSQIERLKLLIEARDKMNALELALTRAKPQKNHSVWEKATIVAYSFNNKKFPWLSPTYLSHLPVRVHQILTEFLNDDELFKARFVNRMFYSWFYEQRVKLKHSRKFNYVRALKLAKMGRVFKKLEYFFVQSNNWNHLLVYLNPYYFPELNFLDVNYSDGHIPSNPNILKIRAEGLDCNNFRNWFTQANFPNIEKLVWAVDGDIRKLMRRHSKLRMIEFECYQNKYWLYITRKEYPSLEEVIFHRESLNGYYGSIDDEGLQVARDMLVKEFSNGQVKLRSQGVRVVLI